MYSDFHFKLRPEIINFWLIMNFILKKGINIMFSEIQFVLKGSQNLLVLMGSIEDTGTRTTKQEQRAQLYRA